MMGNNRTEASKNPFLPITLRTHISRQPQNDPTLWKTNLTGYFRFTCREFLMPREMESSGLSYDVGLRNPAKPSSLKSSGFQC